MRMHQCLDMAVVNHLCAMGKLMRANVEQPTNRTSAADLCSLTVNSLPK